MTVHILNQYLWPDCAPTAIYAEQLGLCFQRNGFEVKMISGSGSYRTGTRIQPALTHCKLPTYTGKRGGVFSTLREYQSVYSAFERYIEAEVRENDIVLCTAAPPQTIHLIKVIKRKKAKGIYRLEDYYPELLRGFLNYPSWVRKILSGYWGRQLSQWHKVVKIASNLAYEGDNACVIRNWPTLDLGQPESFQPKTAYYFGNLGYGHCLQSFLKMCTALRDDGYSVAIVGDGPKVSLLPVWIKKISSPDEATLIALHWHAEIHLLAADPKLTGAIFPSKYWNSRLTGRKIVTAGFHGPMLTELNEVSALTKLPSPEEWLPILKSI